MNRQFADISSNNPSFDAGPYAKWGAVLLGNKVSQATDYVNPTWKARQHEAHTCHVACLDYHFAQGGGRQAGEQQATFFLNELKGSGVFHEAYDPICLDIEQGGAVADPVAFREGFEHVCVERGHDALIVYSDAAYFEEYGEGLAPRGGRVWVAAYPTLPVGWWGEPWAHQDTSAGSVPGIGGPCDVSFLSASAYAWHAAHRP